MGGGEGRGGEEGGQGEEVAVGFRHAESKSRRCMSSRYVRLGQWLPSSHL